MISPQQAINRIPILSSEPFLSVSPLTGGLSNRSYLISTTAQKYVLRLDGEAQAIFKNSRSFEFEILDYAADINIAPQTIYADPTSGILLYVYIEGVQLEKEKLLLPKYKKQFLKMKSGISKLHKHSSSTAPLQKLIAEESLLDSLPKIERLQYLQTKVSPTLELLKRFSSEYCLCHNDLSPQNLLLDNKNKLVVLDWEYIAFNHPLLDFAFFANSWQLSDKLLELHFQDHIFHHEICFTEVRQLAWFIEAVWYAKRQQYSPSKIWFHHLESALQKLNHL